MEFIRKPYIDTFIHILTMNPRFKSHARASEQKMGMGMK